MNTATTPMPTDVRMPAAVATSLYDALLAGDLDGAARFLADDVVLHVPGTHPLAGEHHGPAGVVDFVVGSRALTDDGEQIEVLDVLGGTDHAAVYCRVRATRAGRAPLDNTTVHLLRVRAGRVVELWLHNWDAPVVDEFWS